MSAFPYPISDDERRLMTHINMFGSAGYPVQKLGSRWHWQDAFGVKGAPTVYRTKREAVAAFERWIDMMLERLGEEAYERALAKVANGQPR